jgi:Tol biopolymer transport system component/tRNA A-37 threonylcarbamoyl transferase component Bud32
VEWLFREALERPKEEREAFVTRAEGVRAETQTEVKRLLAEREESLAALHAPAAAQAGDLVGDRYEIETLISQGAQSRVYLARDRRMGGNRVVVKILRGRLKAFQEQQEGLQREIEALARVGHPGVCGLIDQGIWRSALPYLVVQYWDGRTLREVMKAKAMGEEAAVAVLEQLGQILDACHAAGVLHLDVKPENILVEGEDRGRGIRTWLVDFGIALMEGRGKTGSSAGTPSYAAPEQLEGHAGRTADVYALAAVAQEILPVVKGEVRAALERGLAKEPDSRWPSAGLLAQAVSRAVRGRKRRRSAVMLSAAGVALASLMLGGVWWIGSDGQKRLELGRAKQLTILRGVELYPGFAPDGSRIYFSHGVEETGPLAVHSIGIGEREPRKETESEGRDTIPRVSPDGRWLAFAREVNGRREVRVKELRTGKGRSVWEGHAQSLSWGREGKWLYVVEWKGESGRLARIDVQSGRLEPLTIYREGIRGELDVSVSPDGRRLAFARYKTAESGDLHVWDLDERGRPREDARRLTQLARRVHSPAWQSASTLVFSAGTLVTRSLWEVRLDGEPGQERELRELGDGIQSVAADGQGRLVYVKDREDADIWRMELDRPGNPAGVRAMERWAPSTKYEEEPCFGPDGQTVAFLSERSGLLQVWVADRSGGRARQVSRYLGAEKMWLSWTAGGLVAYAFERGRGPGLDAVDSEGIAAVRRVDGIKEPERLVGVSGDGRRIFVVRPDGQQVVLKRCQLDGGGCEPLIRAPMVRVVKEAEAGRVFFSTGRAEEGIWMLEGGRTRRVAGHVRARSSFAARGGWLYYLGADPEMGLHAYRWRDGTRRLLKRLDRLPGWGLTVSPDGREALAVLQEPEDADLVTVESAKR